MERPPGRLHRGPMALAPTIAPPIIHRTMPLTPVDSGSQAPPFPAMAAPAAPASPPRIGISISAGMRDDSQ